MSPGTLLTAKPATRWQCMHYSQVQLSGTAAAACGLQPVGCTVHARRGGRQPEGIPCGSIRRCQQGMGARSRVAAALTACTQSAMQMFFVCSILYSCCAAILASPRFHPLHRSGGARRRRRCHPSTRWQAPWMPLMWRQQRLLPASEPSSAPARGAAAASSASRHGRQWRESARALLAYWLHGGAAWAVGGKRPAGCRPRSSRKLVQACTCPTAQALAQALAPRHAQHWQTGLRALPHT